MGIADQDMRKPTSHGIRGMRERAEQFGGSLSVVGEAGKGTTVVGDRAQAARATRLA